VGRQTAKEKFEKSEGVNDQANAARVQGGNPKRGGKALRKRVQLKGTFKEGIKDRGGQKKSLVRKKGQSIIIQTLRVWTEKRGAGPLKPPVPGGGGPADQQGKKVSQRFGEISASVQQGIFRAQPLPQNSGLRGKLEKNEARGKKRSR